jgi:hypothetical protein
VINKCPVGQPTRKLRGPRPRPARTQGILVEDLHAQPVRLGHCLIRRPGPIMRTAPMPHRFSFEPQCANYPGTCRELCGFAQVHTPLVRQLSLLHKPDLHAVPLSSVSVLPFRPLQLLDSEQHCLNPSLQTTNTRGKRSSQYFPGCLIYLAGRRCNNHHETNPIFSICQILSATTPNVQNLVLHLQPS